MRHFRRMVLAVTAAAGLAIPATAQEEAALSRERATEAKAKCVSLLEGVDGVSSVNYAGSGTDFRLLIVVRDYAAKLAARQKLGGGETFEGVKVMWTIAGSGAGLVQAVPTNLAPPDNGAQPKPPAVPPAPPPGANEPAPVPAGEPDCDIIRAQLGLKALRHPVGGNSWKSWTPCQVWLRAVQGPGGGHSYLYTKHRPGCIYQDGLYSEVYREGFLYPTELRGSDSSWSRQVSQDLEHKFPKPPPPMQPKSGPYRRDTPTGP